MSGDLSSEQAGTDLHAFLGFTPPSQRLAALLSNLNSSSDASGGAYEPEVKVYSDSVYFNYHILGISLLFHPSPTYKAQLKTGLPRAELDESELRLASIDVYNHEGSIDDPASAGNKKSARPSATKPTFQPFPAYPIRVSYSPVPTDAPTSPSEPAPSSTFLATPTTTGKDFVAALGEPDRKGGGEGSMGIWTEFTSSGILVEFASGGLQAWDKGGKAVWKVLTIFERGVVAGKDEGD